MSAWFLSGSRPGGKDYYGIRVRSGGLERGATNHQSHPSRGADPTGFREPSNLEIAVRAAGGTRTDIVSLLSGLSREPNFFNC
jgi:hypothetical protein